MTKLRKFARAYLADFNATNAALSVGASEKSAHVLGSRWLKKVKDSGILAEESERALEQAGVTTNKVLSEIAKLAFANMADYVGVDQYGQPDIDLSTISEEQWAAVQEITVDATGGSGDGERRKVERTRFKLADKGVNLERLGKYLELFTEKKIFEHTGKDGGPIQAAVTVSFVEANAANG